MKKSLDEMSLQELWQLFPIILVPHQAVWFELYEREKDLWIHEFGDAIHRIHHIGSTSVPGLLAKPTIDVLLEIKQDTDLISLKEVALRLGYLVSTHPDNPAPHLLFKKGYTVRGFEGQAFHVHVRYPGDWDELYFRDYLRESPALRTRYEEEKKRLFTRFEHDRNAYTEGKTALIREATMTAKNKWPGRYAPKLPDAQSMRNAG